MLRFQFFLFLLYFVRVGGRLSFIVLVDLLLRAELPLLGDHLLDLFHVEVVVKLVPRHQVLVKLVVSDGFVALAALAQLLLRLLSINEAFHNLARCLMNLAHDTISDLVHQIDGTFRLWWATR